MDKQAKHGTYRQSFIIFLLYKVEDVAKAANKNIYVFGFVLLFSSLKTIACV